jgi:hypothetical protein
VSVLRELVSDHDSGRAAEWSQEERWRVPFLDLLNKPTARTVPPAFSSRRGGVFVAGMLAVAGAFFVWQALLLDVGAITSPGPGFLPLLLGALMIMGAAFIGLQSWLSAEGETIELGHRDVLITASALLAVPLVFERLGAYISLAPLAIVVLALIGRVAPLLAVFATVLGLVGCWLFFEVMLGLQLPSGPL